MLIIYLSGEFEQAEWYMDLVVKEQTSVGYTDFKVKLEEEVMEEQ